MSNVENSLTGNIDHSSKMKDTDFYAPEDPMMQMSTNIPSTDTSVPSTSIITVKDPFDDDDDVKYNFPSHQHQQQLPPQMSMPHFEQIAFSRKPFYPITDRNFPMQMPYAFNRPLLPYPYPDGSILNRSQAYHPMPPMHQMMRIMHPMAMMQRMPNMMPPAPMPPPNPPAPPKPKATRRKQNNNSNNNQQQQHQPPPPAPQMMQQLHMARTPMDMIRPSSSAMRPPDMALHQSMKMNGEMRPMGIICLWSFNIFNSLTFSVKKCSSQRVLDSGVCGGCNAHINVSYMETNNWYLKYKILERKSRGSMYCFKSRMPQNLPCGKISATLK